MTCLVLGDGQRLAARTPTGVRVCVFRHSLEKGQFYWATWKS